MPVPVAGVPFDAHVKVYGAVPPEAVALQVTGLPAVAVPHVTVTTIGCPETMKLVTDVTALLLFASVALTVRVNVPLVA